MRETEVDLLEALPERFAGALQCVAKELHEELGSSLEAIAVTGSVATGEAMPRSDLDIIVIVRALWRQRRSLTVNGVSVELLINPVAQLDRELSDPESGSPTVRMLASSLLFYNSSSEVASLIQRAKDLLNAGRPRPDNFQLLLMKYRLCDAYDDFRDLLHSDNKAAALFTGNAIALQALTLMLRWRGEWDIKPKYFIKRCFELFPRLQSPLEHFYSASASLEVRSNALASIVEQTFGLVGNYDPVWETDKQQLSF